MLLIFIIIIILATSCNPYLPKFGWMDGSEKYYGHVDRISYTENYDTVFYAECYLWSTLYVKRDNEAHTYEVDICGWNDYIRHRDVVWIDWVPPTKRRKGYHRAYIAGYYYMILDLRKYEIDTNYLFTPYGNKYIYDNLIDDDFNYIKIDER